MLLCCIEAAPCFRCDAKEHRMHRKTRWGSDSFRALHKTPFSLLISQLFMAASCLLITDDIIIIFSFTLQSQSVQKIWKCSTRSTSVCKVTPDFCFPVFVCFITRAGVCSLQWERFSVFCDTDVKWKQSFELLSGWNVKNCSYSKMCLLLLSELDETYFNGVIWAEAVRRHLRMLLMVWKCTCGVTCAVQTVHISLYASAATRGRNQCVGRFSVDLLAFAAAELHRRALYKFICYKLQIMPLFFFMFASLRWGLWFYSTLFCIIIVRNVKILTVV